MMSTLFTKALIFVIFFGVASSCAMNAQEPNALPQKNGGEMRAAEAICQHGEVSTVARLLDSKSIEVQRLALTRLQTTKTPAVVPALTRYLSSINTIVEGSELATVNLNLKRLTVSALEANTGRSYAITNFRNVGQIQQLLANITSDYNLQSAKTIDVQSSIAQASSPSSAQTPKAPASPPHEPEQFLQTRYIIFVGAVAVAGLLWLLVKRGNGKGVSL